MTRMLVVEDAPQLARVLVINLQALHYDVDTAPDGATALRLASARPPDAVLLDLGLPDRDGVDVIRGLRGWPRAPILVLSARQSSAEKVSALDAGADDCITKPFGMDELLARLRAAVRRAEDLPLARKTSLVETADFVNDLLAKKVVTGERDVRLTPTEWHLLEILVSHPRRSSPSSTSSTRSGASHGTTGPTTCVSTWPSCVANWRRTLPIPAS